MGRRMGISILGIMLILLFRQETTYASEPTIQSREDFVPIYDKPDGGLTEIGQIRSGEPLYINSDYSESLWQVKFGNGYGYVEKSLVQVENEGQTLAKNNRENTNTVVLVHQNLDVYDDTTGTLEKIAIVKGGFRYPVLASYGSWWQIDVGGRVGLIEKASTTIDQGVPVLMYHHILTPQEKADSPFADLDTTITNTEFNAQMDYLKSNGFTTISTVDLERYLDKQVNLPAKAVVITIDDGNISSRIYAYPKLKQHQFIADQFIITGRMASIPATFDHKNLHFISQREMVEMRDVYRYMAHTDALHQLTPEGKSFVVTKARDEVKEDLLRNRLYLGNTTHFAYPFGQYNEETLDILRETGFTLAYTTKSGRATLGVNKLLIPRLGIVPNLPLSEFAKKVNN